MGGLAAFARVVYVLLLGIWAGAGLYHLVVIMPAALAAFPDKSDALGFLGRALGGLDTYGMLAGPVIVLCLLVGWGGTRRRLGLRAALAALATIGAIVSGQWLSPRIAALEAELAKGVAVNLELNRLYVIGDGLTIGIVVVVILLLVTAPATSDARPGSRIELGLLR